MKSFMLWVESMSKVEQTGTSMLPSIDKISEEVHIIIRFGVEYSKHARLTMIVYSLGKEHNFDKMNSNTRGLKYDYGSVMHYSKTAFSRNGKPTITTKRRASIGQRRGLSRTDWLHVKRNYCRRQ